MKQNQIINFFGFQLPIGKYRNNYISWLSVKKIISEAGTFFILNPNI